jgi:hypothetical protein
MVDGCAAGRDGGEFEQPIPLAVRVKVQFSRARDQKVVA